MKLSIVIPVLNEAASVLPLAEEIHAALTEHAPFEIIFVDDGSTDGTAGAVRRAQDRLGGIRLLRHTRRSGQSAAILTGIRAARAEWIVTMDGDGQNDPADIPRLLEAPAANRNVKLVTGHRVDRQDTWSRRISSRLANSIRARILHDGTPDTGCGLKVMHRETFLDLPQFDHMHRFLPALFRRARTETLSVPVRHRPRVDGVSKYGLSDRLWVGIIDLCGVRWLVRRTPASVLVDEE